ncbi:MAG: AbrB/MazE/SpoVT family DNA-binding domain-containing protein [Patescibacteria group bacterium]|nr:AbrB/MazE/SpoVT family DNA-binding domain-containing protein [Patescibacteria group bacterium]
MQKVLKTGNSMGVTIPSKFVKSVGVKIGDKVKVKTILQTGQVIYTFKGAKQLSIENTIDKTV